MSGPLWAITVLAGLTIVCVTIFAVVSVKREDPDKIADIYEFLFAANSYRILVVCLVVFGVIFLHLGEGLDKYSSGILGTLAGAALGNLSRQTQDDSQTQET